MDGIVNRKNISFFTSNSLRPFRLGCLFHLFIVQASSMYDSKLETSLAPSLLILVTYSLFCMKTTRVSVLLSPAFRSLVHTFSALQYGAR